MLCARTRGVRIPAALNRFPGQCLIQAGKADQGVDYAAEGGGLTEPHAENGGYEIEVKHPDETPVQRADDYQRGCDNVNLLHILCPLFPVVTFSLRICF